MIHENKGTSTAAKEYFEHVVQVMQGNEDFVRNNAKETYDEIVELIIDAIDYVGLAVRRPGSAEEYVKRSIPFFLQHILMPFSYGIYLDLIAGNIPACFMELRLMLESLAKCYLADLRYPDESFFQTKFELLQDENLSTAKLLRELGTELGSEDDFVALWGKLSQDWIHTKGIMDRVTDQIIEKSDIPPWALAIPMNYTASDLDAIDELRKRISQFRRLLTVAMHSAWSLPTSSAAG